jgi:two-component system cell cycle sensor histidine kinase/response regulator CckA
MERMPSRTQASIPARFGNVEQRLRNLIDGLGPSILAGILTPDGRIVETNRSSLLATDLKAEDVIGKRFDELPPWTWSGEVTEQLRVALKRGAAGECSRFDTRVRGAAGELIDVDFSIQPVSDKEQAVSFLVASAVIITARKRAEENALRLNRVYELLSHVIQGIVKEDGPHTILEAACGVAVEKGGFRMAWTGLREPGAGTLAITAHAGATDETLALLRNLVVREVPDCAMTYEALHTGHPGVCNDIETDPRAAGWREAALTRGYASMASMPLRLRGRVAGTFNVYAAQKGFFSSEELRLLGDLARNISLALEVADRETERQRAEEALRVSEHRFRELAENIDEVFWMSDPKSRQVLYVSPAFEKIWGLPRDRIYEHPSAWSDSIHADDRQSVLHALQTKRDRGDYAETYRIERPDGTLRWIRDRAFPVRGSDGEILHVVGIAEDITEQRRLEERVAHAQKMEAIGQLAGGVAHDFNNILTVIQGFGSLLMLEDLTPSAAEAAREIVHAAERASSLTRQLLAFGRRQVLQPQTLDVNAVVLALNSMLQRIVGEDVELVLRLHPDPLRVKADPGMLDQVLMNLVVNARDAMPGGGRVTIETLEKSASAGATACLRVVDCGTGIAPEQMPRIFEPFFTTKGPGKGTGLGLATVYGIVEQHRGSLAVESELGRGTTVEILLPLDSSADAARPLSSEGGEVRGGSETILVVEDDPHVRALTRTILERQGYRIHEAGHGVEALRVWEQHGGRIDLLLTDMVMPEGLSGQDLATRLLARKPDLRVIFTSGYSPDTAGRELTSHERQHYIQKPAKPRVLLETVRRCLDGEISSSSSASISTGFTR